MWLCSSSTSIIENRGPSVLSSILTIRPDKQAHHAFDRPHAATERQGIDGLLIGGYDLRHGRRSAYACYDDRRFKKLLSPGGLPYITHRPARATSTDSRKPPVQVVLQVVLFWSK